MSAVWEPIAFEVGQRVQIRLSGECCQDWEDSAWIRGHDPTIDGLHGEIVGYLDDRRWPHHPWHVVLDRFVRDSRDGLEFNGCYMASSELIPISDASDRATDEAAS